MMSNRVQFLGHAALLLQCDGRSILIDPFLTGNPKAAIKAEDATADLSLISHGHGDHVGDSIAIAKRTGAMIASNYEISGWLQQPAQGLSSLRIYGLQHGGSFLFDNAIRIKLTWAVHGSIYLMVLMVGIHAALSYHIRPELKSMMPLILHFLVI
jgi:L-ascorbate metabolism protein UlaG (beta-lactamase superfamily)